MDIVDFAGDDVGVISGAINERHVAIYTFADAAQYPLRGRLGNQCDYVDVAIVQRRRLKLP
jgi:hypothetical protein